MLVFRILIYQMSVRAYMAQNQWARSFCPPAISSEILRGCRAQLLTCFATCPEGQLWKYLACPDQILLVLNLSLVENKEELKIVHIVVFWTL